MFILIAEDEPLTAARLKKMTERLVKQPLKFKLVDSVTEVIECLEQAAQPDLILLDIHLADGSSLEIFSLRKVSVPIIFTTAFDEHAVKAFRLNAVDYLLKPIKEEELSTALEKWLSKPTNIIDYRKLAVALNAEQSLNRFLIRSGQQLHLVESDQVSCFFSEDRATILYTFDEKKFVIDNSLDSLESELDGEIFFRVNRQFIVNRSAIKELYTYSKSRVKLLLTGDLETIVSTERSPHFKSWLVTSK